MTPTDCHVLLVDDDPAMLRLLAQWLQRAGYLVRTACDGQEALEAIELECPNILVTDWQMPRISGLDLCQFVRKMQLPHYVYILFLTVKSGSDAVISGLDAGADDYLVKPVHEGELLARLRSGSRVLEMERRLISMARIDSLTGLLTRRAFYELLEKEWRRTKRFHLPLSCVMLDLDAFKRVNDVYGHHVGDTVLKYVAKLLVDNCRASDFVCRYGGDEFCIMLPETEEAGAMQWAERACHGLASRVIPTGRGDVHLSGSFGVAQCHDAGAAKELVDMADQALLGAKQSGRNRVVQHSSQPAIGAR